MPKIIIDTMVEANLDVVIKYFNSELFVKLAPPVGSLNLIRFDGNSPGSEVHLELSFFGIKQRWVSLIVDESHSTGQYYFIDVGKQLPFPLKTWHHKHMLKQAGAGTTQIVDEIDYDCDSVLFNGLTKPMMTWMFRQRIPIYQSYFKEKSSLS